MSCIVPCGFFFYKYKNSVYLFYFLIKVLLFISNWKVLICSLAFLLGLANWSISIHLLLFFNILQFIWLLWFPIPFCYIIQRQTPVKCLYNWFFHSFIQAINKTLTHTGLGAGNRTVIKKNNSCLHDLSMYPGLQRLGQDYILFKRLTFWCDKCSPSFKVPEKHLLGGLQIKLNSYRSGVWQTKYKGSLRV